MTPPLPSLSDEVWRWLCATELVRPAVVAAGRARVAANDWPPPLDIADAMIAGSPRALVALR